MASETGMAAAVEYHFDLESENRETVREQGTAINRSLKKLKKISSGSLPAVTERDDEPTQQHVTIPAVRAVDQRLKAALEEAEEACRKSSQPPPATAEASGTAKKKKRWFGWKD